MTNPPNNTRMGPAVMVVHGPAAFDHGDGAWLKKDVRPVRVIAGNDLRGVQP